MFILQGLVPFQSLISLNFAQLMLNIYFFFLNLSQLTFQLCHFNLQFLIELTHWSEHLIIFGKLNGRYVFFEHGYCFSETFVVYFVFAAFYVQLLNYMPGVVVLDYLEKLADYVVFAV